MKGIINVLKPTGMTSHDVVGFIRRTLNIKKVGHTGTLDPNAAGVLPICIGKATKVSQFLLYKDKKYRGELTLGTATDTQDRYGKIVAEAKVNVNEADIRDAFSRFKGEILQIPPMFSAIKYKGKKLYELAREGKTIEREPRKVTIYNLDIIQIIDNRILFDVECSRGTYVRTLCNDIGESLNTFGHMSMLVRTTVDRFTIYDSFTLDEIKKYSEDENINLILKPIDFVLTKYKKLILDDEYFKILENGGKISLSNSLSSIESNIIESDKLRVYCKDQFVGIGVINNYNDEKCLKMEKVFL